MHIVNVVFFYDYQLYKTCLDVYCQFSNPIMQYINRQSTPTVVVLGNMGALFIPIPYHSGITAVRKSARLLRFEEEE